MFFCGYSRYNGVFDFHHIDGKAKDFGVSLDGLTRSWERVERELNKCVLVCANCHREIHGGILQPSGEIQNEKWGELREALKGNPEPSLANGITVARKAQRLRVRSQSNKLSSAPHPNG
jgi:hypothetical protein